MHPGIRCKSRKTKKKNFLKLPLHIKEKTKKKYNFFFGGGGNCSWYWYWYRRVWLRSVNNTKEIFVYIYIQWQVKENSSTYLQDQLQTFKSEIEELKVSTKVQMLNFFPLKHIHITESDVPPLSYASWRVGCKWRH